MGQLADGYTRMLDLLALVKAAAPVPGLRIYDDGEPVELPEMPAAWVLMPDEDYENMDTMSGRSIATFTLRIVTDPRKPVTALLVLADVVITVADPWLRTEHPAPIDQSRRISMRRVSPELGGIVVRGADFPVRLELAFRAINP